MCEKKYLYVVDILVLSIFGEGVEVNIIGEPVY